MLDEVLSKDFKYLWRNKSIDEYLYKYFTEYCMSVMGTAAISKNEVRKCVFRILELVSNLDKESSNNI